MKRVLAPRKRPTQERARVTVDAILDAAAHIFTGTEFDVVTTNDVAERAGVSIGSLYQYFPNKLALLESLKERHTERLMSRMNEACARATSLSLSETIRAIVAASTSYHAEHATLLRLFWIYLPPDQQGQHLPGAASFRRNVQVLLDSHSAELQIHDLNLALFMMRTLAKSTMEAAARDRIEDLRNGTIARELAATMLLYLTGKSD
ncbi:MAG TPA: TetR/AcrR family transcriptional regulator [Opitutaceae bacterium]|nr:TetR/AcrR family transcriptional regulator [Opitutaceae bacterium]